MSVREFRLVHSFEEIIEAAKDLVKGSDTEYRLNFSLRVEFDTELLGTPQLRDFAQLATDFQAINRPDNLYLNHGEYIGENGIQHVIDELKNKRIGNRALISLIAQQDIIGSGDDPIPSFMVMQFSVEGSSLYATTYFRALEVAKFLRINMEEIRQISAKICEALPFVSRVRLNVFSFRAYINERINPLLRPRIEVLDSINILKLMEKNPSKLSELLNEKLHMSTKVESKSLQIMDAIVHDDDKNQDVQSCFKTTYVKRLIRECLESANKLIEARKRASPVSASEEAQLYLDSLNKLVKEMEKC